MLSKQSRVRWMVGFVAAGTLGALGVGCQGDGAADDEDVASAQGTVSDGSEKLDVMLQVLADVRAAIALSLVLLLVTVLGMAVVMFSTFAMHLYGLYQKRKKEYGFDGVYFDGAFGSVAAAYQVVLRTRQVIGDEGKLLQVFVNVMKNSIEAMPRGGHLGCATKPSDEYVVQNRQMKRWAVISVSDTGKGIPTENLSHIFEPFFTTKKTCSGAGLGLSVVYGIVRDHKGSIKVDSVLRQGTTFTIRLPAVKTGKEHVATQ